MAIEIPASVSSIGTRAFSNCTKLNDIYYIGIDTEWQAIAVGEYNDNFENANVHLETSMPCIHDPSKAVKENEIAATYGKEGSYESVVCCSVCGTELERTPVKVAKLKKTSLAKATVSGIKNKTFTGSALTQNITVTLGGKTLENSKDYEITYKNNKSVGLATVTVTGINAYSGTVSKTFKINPKGTSLSGVTAKSKGFTVKWNKQTMQTSGYQIQYAADSKFTKNAKTVTVSKNSTASKKISKLTGKKKYYVRIRTYKTVNGTKYYSSWSSSKKVTTKK